MLNLQKAHQYLPMSQLLYSVQEYKFKENSTQSHTVFV